MSVSENLEVVASFVKAVDASDWDAAKDCMNEGAVLNFYGSQGGAVRPQDAIEGWKAEAVAFPDARREIVRSFGQGDLLCAEIRESGTHDGPLGHAGKVHPPTGKRFQISICAVFRVQDGKISEAWVYFDPRDHLMQLGIS